MKESKGISRPNRRLAPLAEAVRGFTTHGTDIEKASRREVKGSERRTREKKLDQQFEELVDAASVDILAEAEEFIESKAGVPSTQKAYSAALSRFFSWCQTRGKNGTHPLRVNPGVADSFITELNARKLSASTVNLTVSGVSAWYGWMGRRYPWVKNPMEKTRERPKVEFPASRIPTIEEIHALIRLAKPPLGAAVGVLAFCGVRVDSLPMMTVDGQGYTSVSKGKRIRGPFPEEAAVVVKRAGLDAHAPFGAFDVSRSYWSKMIFSLSEKAFEKGLLRYRYSAHDFRHFFACTEYMRDKDIDRVRRLLGHKSISTTFRYLTGLGILSTT